MIRGVRCIYNYGWLLGGEPRILTLPIIRRIKKVIFNFQKVVYFSPFFAVFEGNNTKG